MSQKFYFLLFVSFFFSTNLLAQDAIELKDATEIRYRAKSLIENDLRDLMNGISDVNVGSSDVEEMINNSFSSQTKKIFLSKDVIIEDDINPNFHSSGRTSDMRVEQYFKELDLKYRKSDGQSIVFTDISVSNVKKTNSLYVKVYYSSIFKNKNKYIDTTYLPNNRVAEISVHRGNNNWVVYISRLGFFNPLDTANDNSTDIPIISEKIANTTSAAVDSVSLAEQQKSFDEKLKLEKDRQLAENDRRETEQFKQLMNKGDKSLEENDFTSALGFYKQASDMRPYDPTIRAKINLANKKREQATVTNEQLFRDNLRFAELAESKREYEKAIDFYNKAFDYKPEEKSKFEQHLQELLSIYRVISKLDAKYNSGLYKETISEYKDLIKKNGNISDYYLGTAKCYDKLNDYSRALKNYKLAIEKDGNNLEAIQMEADLYKRNKNLFDALGDYNTYLAINKTNDAIFDSTAKLYILVNNDENKAIQVLSDGITHNPKSSILYLERGLLMINKKEYKTAENDFSNSIGIDSSALAYYNRGKSRLLMGQVQNAAMDFEMARQNKLNAYYTSLIGGFAESLYSRAAEKFIKSDKDSAIILIDDAIAINPYSDKYSFTRGEYYFSQNNFKEAISSYDVAVKLNATFAEAFYKRGLSYYNLVDYKAAINDFGLAQSKNTQYYLAQKGSGDSYFALKDFSNAASNFEKCIQTMNALKNNPDQIILAQAYNSLGMSYFSLNKYDQSITALKNAIKKNSGFAEAYFNRGLTYYKTNQLSDAINDFKQALSLESNHYQWQYYLGKAYQDKKEQANAVVAFSNCISQDSLSKMPDAFYSRGFSNLQMANYGEALKDYLKTQSLGLEPTIKNFYAELGTIYLNLDKHDEAFNAFNTAYSKDNSNAHVMFGIASSLFLSSKNEESMTWFEKAFQTKTISKSEIKKDKLYGKLSDDPKFKSLMKKYY